MQEVNIIHIVWPTRASLFSAVLKRYFTYNIDNESSIEVFENNSIKLFRSFSTKNCFTPKRGRNHNSFSGINIAGPCGSMTLASDKTCQHREMQKHVVSYHHTADS